MEWDRHVDAYSRSRICRTLVVDCWWIVGDVGVGKPKTLERVADEFGWTPPSSSQHLLQLSKPHCIHSAINVDKSESIDSAPAE